MGKYSQSARSVFLFIWNGTEERWEVKEIQLTFLGNLAYCVKSSRNFKTQTTSIDNSVVFGLKEIQINCHTYIRIRTKIRRFEALITNELVCKSCYDYHVLLMTPGDWS